MAKLKVYGTPQSRAMRTLWLCRELGLDFDHEPTHFTDPALRADTYLAINPNGRIPSIQDGNLSLWESMAINLYLAKKHGGALAPRNLEEEAVATQWSLWVMTEVEKPALDTMLRRMKFPAGSKEEAYFATRFPKDEAAEAKNVEALDRPFGALERSLAGRDYLLGDRFTVADLNVAAVMAWARAARIDLAAYPRVRSWLDRCLSRPAFGV